MAFRLSRLSSTLKQRVLSQAPFVRDVSKILFYFATWIPVIAFANSHGGILTVVSGSSMYPYLNTDYDRSLKEDIVLVKRWKPAEGLKRGMIVTLWYVGNVGVAAFCLQPRGILHRHYPITNAVNTTGALFIQKLQLLSAL